MFPTREYEWIDFRNCELLRSDSGVAGTNCVFRTGALTDGVDDVWVVSRYEPSIRIDFIHVTRRLGTKDFNVFDYNRD